jgi:tetratricopeptide (TPR) repeat protein
LLAAYYRHAGLQEDVDSTVKAILEFAESHQDNKDLVWFAAEALLLNGRFDEGIELTTTAKIEKAFTLLTFRHEYARALALVGLENAVVPDRKWYDELPCEGRSEQETKQRRFDFALRLARIQKHLGRDDNAEQILSVVNEFVGSVPATGSSPQRSYFQEKLAAALYHMGFLERSWAVAAETTNVNSTYAPNVLNLIYGTREIEADAWWVFFRDKFPEESLTSCFNRVHLALNPAHDEAEGAYTVTVREAIAFAPTLRSVSQRDAFWKGIGLTSRIRGHRAEAIECLQHAAVSIPDAARTVADLRAELGQWPEAAQSYRALWEKDHEQLGALYLAGDALERAGETEQGAAWKQEANLLAIRSRTRHTMSVDLANRGLTEEAVAQWELLIKTAPLESWELNDAARRLGDYCVSTEPQRAAELWERYLLGDLRPCFWFLKDESYLRMPFVIQKARAAQAIQDGQLDALRDALATATKAAPSDTRLAEELVPVLEAAGHQAEADRLAAVLIDHYRGRSKAYPKSAYFHNNLAWVAARCHRELDLAMEHATQATLLEPKNGSYIDTLAEVHFQLGDREAAIRESERALRQSPFDRSLRQQLERFRNEVIPQRHDDI